MPCTVAARHAHRPRRTRRHSRCNFVIVVEAVNTAKLRPDNTKSCRAVMEGTPHRQKPVTLPGELDIPPVDHLEPS
jgi:hypothetical protein